MILLPRIVRRTVMLSLQAFSFLRHHRGNRRFRPPLRCPRLSWGQGIQIRFVYPAGFSFSLCLTSRLLPGRSRVCGDSLQVRIASVYYSLYAGSKSGSFILRAFFLLRFDFSLPPWYRRFAATACTCKFRPLITDLTQVLIRFVYPRELPSHYASTPHPLWF